VRDINETDPLASKGWPVPRLSIIDPAEATRPLPQHLLLLERTLHIILVPTEALDPRHPGRRIGDVTPPEVMHLDAFQNLLQL
jgi:hypothetical protein